jgi:hypothetical protein
MDKRIQSPLYFKLLASQALQILNLNRATRTPELIRSQYDGGVWSSDLARIHESKTLEEYLFPKDSNYLLRRQGNYFARASTNLDYLKEKASLLEELLGDNHSLGELGCGSGWNLMVLRAGGFKGKLYGADISPTGLEVIKVANKKWNLQIDTELVDLNSLRVHESKTVSEPGTLFTYLALEQLPITASQLLKNITGSFPEKKILLFESSCELFPLHYSEILSKIYVIKRDYLRCLRENLSSLNVKVTILRLRFSHRIGNEIACFQIN